MHCWYIGLDNIFTCLARYAGTLEGSQISGCTTGVKPKLNSIAELVSDHVSRETYGGLPVDAVKAAKLLILDTLGVGWAGATAATSRPLLEMFAEQGGKADACIWGTASRAPLPSAAFLNSVFAASLDFDAVDAHAMTHPGIVIVPAALAICEKYRLSGEEFLGAVTVGVDLLNRFSRATQDHKGWFYTSLHGVFAAAAISAKLLGLGSDGILNAIGIAQSQACGTQQPIIERTLTKRLQAAFACQAGVQAALLARAGITGPRAPFDGPFGIYALYEPGDQRAITGDLGTRYYGTQLNLKKYPSCACTHAAIDAALELVAEHHLSVDEIRDISVRISPYMYRLVGAPFEPTNNVQVAAQFSIQYAIACAFSRGRFGIEDIEEAAAQDPLIGQMARRIRVIADPSWSGTLAPAELEVLTEKRGRLLKRVDHIQGTPENPLTESQIAAKFLYCVSSNSLTDYRLQRAQELLSRIQVIERLPDIATLFDPSVPRSRTTGRTASFQGDNK